MFSGTHRTSSDLQIRPAVVIIAIVFVFLVIEAFNTTTMEDGTILYGTSNYCVVSDDLVDGLRHTLLLLLLLRPRRRPLRRPQRQQQQHAEVIPDSQRWSVNGSTFDGGIVDMGHPRDDVRNQKDVKRQVSC